MIVADVNGPVWLPENDKLLYVKRDFKKDNPIKWISVDGSLSGHLVTNTQLNSDLDLHVSASRLRLAFTAHGLKGADRKTWRQIFVMDLDPSVLK